MDLARRIERILTDFRDGFRRRFDAELDRFARSLRNWIVTALPYVPAENVQRELFRFLASWERDGLFLDSDSRAALEAWIIAKGKSIRARAQRALEPPETVDQDGTLLLPSDLPPRVDPLLAEKLNRLLALIRATEPPDRALADVRKLLAKLGLPPETEAAILEQFLRAYQEDLFQRRFQLPRDSRPFQATEGPPTILGLIGQVVEGVDTLLVEKQLDDLLRALVQLVERMPELLPDSLRGGEIEDAVRELQALMQLVLELLAVLPPEAAEVAVDLLQFFLDIGGLIPGAGEPFDFLSAVIALRRGEKLDAFLSGLSLVPVAGMFSGGGKLLLRVKKLARLIDALKGGSRVVLRKLIDFLLGELARFRPGLEWLKSFLARLKQKLAETIEELKKTQTQGKRAVKNAADAFLKKIGLSRRELAKSARQLDGGGLTAAGRALTKHGSGARPGNRLFPAAKGKRKQINDQAESIVVESLYNSGTTINTVPRRRFGDAIEVIAPDGRGIVFDIKGKVLLFIE